MSEHGSSQSPNQSEAASRLVPTMEHTALNITTRCNQDCIFCFEGDRANRSEPSLEDVRRLLDEAAQRSKLVVFMGGEALLRPDILEVVAYAKSLGLGVDVFTNGQALNRAGFVSELADAGLTALEVSFHYPDAQTHARATQRSPRSFERVLGGLRNVRLHHEHRGSRTPRLTIETNCFAFNDGKLTEIVALLEKTLGPSFAAMRIGALQPCHTKSNEYLLEPLRRRRDELTTLLPSLVRKIEVSFSKMPLCLAPGWEHLSVEVNHRARNVPILSNFADKGAIQDMFQDSRGDEHDPYRWVCRDCNLAVLCQSDRTSWYHKSFHPNHEQKPIPFRDTTLEDVLEKLPGIDPRAFVRLTEETAALHAVPDPVYALARSAQALNPSYAHITDICCGDHPDLDILLEHAGEPEVLTVAVARRGIVASQLGPWFVATRTGNTNEISERLFTEFVAHSPKNVSAMEGEAGELLKSFVRRFGGRVGPDCRLAEGWRFSHFELGTQPIISCRVGTGSNFHTLVLTTPPSVAPEHNYAEPIVRSSAFDIHVVWSEAENDERPVSPSVAQRATLVFALSRWPDEAQRTLSLSAELLLAMRHHPNAGLLRYCTRHRLRIATIQSDGFDGVRVVVAGRQQTHISVCKRAGGTVEAIARDESNGLDSKLDRLLEGFLQAWVARQAP